MTRDEIIYQRRVRVLEHAAETGNVAETCRTFGISRKTFYEWRTVAERYGLDALMPKARRRPQLPNATPTHVLHELLAIAVAEPTLGCRQLADPTSRSSSPVTSWQTHRPPRDEWRPSSGPWLHAPLSETRSWSPTSPRSIASVQ